MQINWTQSDVYSLGVKTSPNSTDIDNVRFTGITGITATASGWRSAVANGIRLKQLLRQWAPLQALTASLSSVYIFIITYKRQGP